MESKNISHPFSPIYDEFSKVLILGSFPSVKSRELEFYFSHPRNRFWKTLAKVFDEFIPISIDEKLSFLKRNNIALFDVVKKCDITLSSDSSIKNVIPNDISMILNKANIKAIFTIGKKSHELYQKYLYPKTNICDICLPSTSPANSIKGIDDILYEKYQIIKYYTKQT